MYRTNLAVTSLRYGDLFGFHLGRIAALLHHYGIHEAGHFGCPEVLEITHTEDMP